jgi:hypothetical protein
METTTKNGTPVEMVLAEAEPSHGSEQTVIRMPQQEIAIATGTKWSIGAEAGGKRTAILGP